MYDASKNEFLKNQEILVSGKNIVKVGKNLSAPANAEIFDLSNSTVIPGLIDAHTHFLTLQKAGEETAIDAMLNSDVARILRAAKIARQYLEAGITTVRDLGNSGQYLDVSLRDAIRNCSIDGPSMQVSGPIISPIGGQWVKISDEVVAREYSVIKNKDEATAEVMRHIHHDVDIIKITVDNSPNKLLLSEEEIKAITVTAHAYGLKVTAHATSDQSVRSAIYAGVDGIEHGYSIADSTLDLMVKRNVYLVPTDVSLDGAFRIVESMGRKPSKDELMQYPVSPWQNRLKRAYDKGVVIVSGSDKYLELNEPYGEIAKDVLVAYFETKIPVKDVIRFATYNASIALGQKDRIGVLKEGAKADIVAFDGDLESDFKTVLRRTNLVMHEGKIYVRK